MKFAALVFVGCMLFGLVAGASVALMHRYISPDMAEWLAILWVVSTTAACVVFMAQKDYSE